MAIQQTRAYQPLFFQVGVDLGKLCYEQTISTWVVKSDLLIGVKLKHVLTMGDKSPGIRTPLYKETNIVPNDCCRICRIYVKISGRSKINVFGYNNKDFSQTLSSVLSAVYMTQRDYLSEVPVGSCKVVRRSCRFAGIPPKIVILICILAIWLAFWFGGSISFFCGTTALGRVMQHNKPLRLGMDFQRFLLTQCQK